MTSKKSGKKENDPDKSLNELLQIFIGMALIEKTKHNLELNKVARQKVASELEKTDIYKEVVGRASKEN